MPGKEPADEGGSAPCSHTMQGARAPGETPDLHGAHLAATKANWEEKQIGAACDALVPGFGLGSYFMLQMPGSSPQHTSLLLLSSPHWELLLLRFSLSSPVRQLAILLECEHSYCLLNYLDVSDAMSKCFARPDPVSV